MSGATEAARRTVPARRTSESLGLPILVLLVGDRREADVLVVMAWLEHELIRPGGRVGLPGEARVVGRIGRIGAIDDDQPAREGLRAPLDPDLPVLVAFAVGV